MKRLKTRFALPMRYLRRSTLLHDDAGVTAIEFGLLALPFFAIICAIMETAVVSLANNVLQSALHDSVRLIRTGQVQQDPDYDIDDFRAELCSRTYGMFDCGAILINVRETSSFSAVSFTEPVDPETLEWTIVEGFQPGVSKDIVVAEAYYKWPTIFDIMGFNLASLSDGTVLMGSAEVWRNEPFGG